MGFSDPTAMFDTERRLPPVGGRLLKFSKAWAKISTDKWTLSVVRSGYVVPFRVRPPLTKVAPLWLRKPPQSQEKVQLLQEEISSLLAKKAIELVSSRHPTRGFFSRLFLVRKRSGDWRPVIDLSRLNRFVQIPRFKMETLEEVRLALRKNDWVTSLDLKDAYFHVPIHARSRRYLRFHFLGRTYQFRALCFGLATAPYVFTRLVKTVVRHCRRHMGMRLHTYLDDWLQPAQGEESAHFNIQRLLKCVLQLGFVPNWEKSDLVPSQNFVFLGARCDSRKALIGPSLDRISRLQKTIQTLLGQRYASARELHSLLGQMESMARLLPQGRAHKRLLQWHIKERWSQQHQCWDDKLCLVPWFRPAVSQWLDTNFMRSMVPLQAPDPDFHLYTDASLTGWGAHLEDLSVSGLWSQRWIGQHINVLELQAVRLALEEFCPYIRDSCVLLATDNTTVSAYLNKEGGARSHTLCSLATKILSWCQEEGITLRARFLPGKLNVLADCLSRRNRIVHTEWTLHAGVLSQIFHFWDTPHVDLFATRLNRRLPIFVSPVQDPLALAVDALAMSWEGMFAYAFPPSPILSKVLLKIQRENCLVILIAPCWEAQPWFPRLLSLLVAPPIRLPCRKDLLAQPQSNLTHPKPQIFRLHAWMCCREVCRRQAFLRSLPPESVQPGELPPMPYTGIGGKYGWIGVSDSRWIPSILL